MYSWETAVRERPDIRHYLRAQNYHGPQARSLLIAIARMFMGIWGAQHDAVCKGLADHIVLQTGCGAGLSRYVASLLLCDFEFKRIVLGLPVRLLRESAMWVLCGRSMGVRDAILTAGIMGWPVSAVYGAEIERYVSWMVECCVGCVMPTRLQGAPRAELSARQWGWLDRVAWEMCENPNDARASMLCGRPTYPDECARECDHAHMRAVLALDRILGTESGAREQIRLEEALEREVRVLAVEGAHRAKVEMEEVSASRCPYSRPDRFVFHINESATRERAERCTESGSPNRTERLSVSPLLTSSPTTEAAEIW
jgi:hypothetical protein